MYIILNEGFIYTHNFNSEFNISVCWLAIESMFYTRIKGNTKPDGGTKLYKPNGRHHARQGQICCLLLLL